MIPTELLEKYQMGTIDHYETEDRFYRTFLKQTDYICNKIVEGVSTWADYPEELQYRQYARDMLSSSENL